MKKILLLTDAAADIPEKILKTFEIKTIGFRIDGEHKTSQPSPIMFKDFFQRGFKEADK